MPNETIDESFFVYTDFCKLIYIVLIKMWEKRPFNP